jgi:hypothetical protein
VAPVYAPGVALYVRWGLQYLLLGGYAVALALAPGRTLAPVLGTLGRHRLTPSSDRGGAAFSLPPTRALTPHALPGSRPEPVAGARGARDP